MISPAWCDSGVPMTAFVRGLLVLAASVPLVFLLMLSACGRPNGTLRPEALVDAGTRCIARVGCPPGQACADLTGYLPDAGEQAICVWGDTPCDAIRCESGRCVNLETAPSSPHCE